MRRLALDQPVAPSSMYRAENRGSSSYRTASSRPQAEVLATVQLVPPPPPVHTQQLYLIRGLPGSGKTTKAHALKEVLEASGAKVSILSADDYFMRDGKYEFDWESLEVAHRYCMERCYDDLGNGLTVIVTNMFTEGWMLSPYYDMANPRGIQPIVIDLYDGGLSNIELFKRNVHGVPLETIEQVRFQWAFDAEKQRTPPDDTRQDVREGAMGFSDDDVEM